MHTIVSLSPIAVESDSRTFKQAASVARFGCRSIVVEGEPSRLSREELPFELRAATGSTNRRATLPSLPSGQALPGRDSGNAPRAALLQTVPGGRGPCRAVPDSILNAYTGPDAGPDGILLRLSRAVKSITARGAIPLQSELQFLRFLHRFGRLSLGTLMKLPRADLYYLHSPAQFFPVYLMCKLTNARFIYDAHDFYSGLEPRKNRPPIMRDWVDPFYRRVEALCIRKASAVVTVCPGIAGLLQRKYGCRPVVVRNCHDERLDRYSGVGLREELRLPPEAFLIVAVGNAKEGQATDSAIEAMSMLPGHVHLAFVGAGYETVENTVRRRGLARRIDSAEKEPPCRSEPRNKACPELVSGFGAGPVSESPCQRVEAMPKQVRHDSKGYCSAESRIHFVAPVKPFEVVPFLRSADAAILLYYSRSVNYQYSLPNRFFQSIAAALPLLYPGLTEIRRIADNYRIGIEIEPRSPESIASGLRKLVNNAHLRCSFRENAHEAAQALRWEKEETVLRELIEEVLENGSRTAQQSHSQETD